MHQAQQKTAAELAQEIAELSALVNEHKEQLREAAAGSEEHTALTKLLNKEKPKLSALEFKLRGQKAVEASERAEREKTQAEETARAEKQEWLNYHMSGLNEEGQQDFERIIEQLKIWISAKKFTPQVVELSKHGNSVLDGLMLNRATNLHPRNMRDAKLLKKDYKFLHAIADGGAGARAWLAKQLEMGGLAKPRTVPDSWIPDSCKPSAEPASEESEKFKRLAERLIDRLGRSGYNHEYHMAWKHYTEQEQEAVNALNLVNDQHSYEEALKLYNMCKNAAHARYSREVGRDGSSTLDWYSRRFDENPPKDPMLRSESLRAIIEARLAENAKQEVK